MLALPFELSVCSAECGAECGSKPEKCPVFPKLPPEFQEICRNNPHLLQYLQMLPPDKFGIPEYHEKVSRALKGTKDPNLIYNVGGGVFVHVLANKEDVRDYYIAVEPSLIDPQENTLDEIELRLADFVEELEGVDDSAKRLEIIMKIVERLVHVTDGKAAPPPKKAEGPEDKKHQKQKTGSKGKIRVSRLQYNALRYLLRRKLEGMGVLDPMILDPNIEDISCAGLGNIFVEHKIFGSLRTSIGFDTNEALDKFVIELAEGIKHPVTFREPVVDATLPDGSRINIVYGTDVSKRGSNFTIRKFSDTPLSILELIQFGALSYDMAAYLSIILQEGMNVWYPARRPPARPP
jgi:flagellar protein FlaI